MVNIAVQKVGSEILISLKTARTFDELKMGLIKKISMIEDYRLGNEVVIDTGSYELTGKQIRDLEDLLLDYGFHLKDLFCSGEFYPDIADPGDIEAGNVFTALPEYENTVMIRRHLRSGQKVFTEGNIVVLGDINPGAEVIAGGNILVMGSIKGMAHAGALGDESAMIAAYRLKPTQLRIASHITRAPDGEVVAMDMPELARIKAGKVVIERLKI